MKDLRRLIAVFLAGMMLYASIWINPIFASFDEHSGEKFGMPASVWKGKTNPNCFYDRTENLFDSSLYFNFKQPAPQFNLSFDFNVFEFSIGNEIKKYILLIRNLCPGLSVREIIFPFHYFW